MSSSTRRNELLVEARRKRNAWVEAARDGGRSGNAGFTRVSIGGGTHEQPKRKDSAVELLVDRFWLLSLDSREHRSNLSPLSYSGVSASLPSAMRVVDFLAETLAEVGLASK